MGRIVLVSGGSRSGKSSYAERLAEETGSKKYYIATCPRVDNEIAQRIDKHISNRAGNGWVTIEEELRLSNEISQLTGAEVILVDCLTLWINNLMYHHQKKLSEDDITVYCDQLIKNCQNISATVIFVTGEVGSGIIPENSDARLYRDLVGWCNQQFGKSADSVILVSCGIAQTIKPE